jgi:hypothetical protein
MPRRREIAEVSPTKFSRVFEIEIDGFTINHKDIIKIKGQYGIQFKFHSLVTNTETGVQWIDCFETHRGQAGSYRSFRIDEIKRVPRRRSSGKVRRRRASTAS